MLYVFNKNKKKMKKKNHLKIVISAATKIRSILHKRVIVMLQSL